MRYGNKAVYVGRLRFNSATMAADYLGIRFSEIQKIINSGEKVRGHRVSYDPPHVPGKGKVFALLPGLCTMRLGAYRGGTW